MRGLEIQFMTIVKAWFQSKTVWFNLIMTVLGVITLLQGTFPQYSTIFVLLTGIGNLILRIYFTNTTISAGQPTL